MIFIKIIIYIKKKYFNKNNVLSPSNNRFLKDIYDLIRKLLR